MSAKDCGSHGKKRRKLIRRIIAGTLIFLFISLLTILIVWAILRPKKPTFTLQDATVYAFNATSSPTSQLTSNFQLTFLAANPNSKIGVHYDKLDIYARYRSQQITLRTRIMPFYQGRKEVNVWSPFVYGTSVPVAPFNVGPLSHDQDVGSVMITIEMDGRVRFKVGSFVSGGYRLFAKCSAFIQFGNWSGNGAVKYQLSERCSVSV